MSAWSLAGRFRGRPDFPRGPIIAGMASTSGSSCVASCALAPESRTAKGMPRRSTTRWYFDPGLPRSTGLRPVCWPPFSPGCSGSRRWLGTNRWRLRHRASSAASRAAAPRPWLSANRAAAASRSCRSRSPVLWATAATDSLSAARRRCPRARYGRGCGGDPPWAWAVPAAGTGRWLPKDRWGQAVTRS